PPARRADLVPRSVAARHWAADSGKGAATGAVRLCLRAELAGTATGTFHRVAGRVPVARPRRQRGSRVRRVRRPDAVACPPGGPLPSPGGEPCLDRGTRRVPARRRGYGGRVGPVAAAPVPPARLVVVRGDALPGDRPDAGGAAGLCRPLHLPAAR